MSALVQISDMRYPLSNRPAPFTNWPDAGHEMLSIVQVANKKRPKEILGLVDALTAMFERIGMREICQSCWAGRLNNNRPAGVGCCGQCPLVGHKACLAKPLGCALFMCYDETQRRFPRTVKFLELIRSRLHAIGGKGDWGFVPGCFPGAVYRESRLGLGRQDRKLLRVLIAAVANWSEVL